jgi:hypothetical protein
MKTINYLLMAVMACGCSTLHKNVSSSEMAAIGIWEEYGPPVYPVITITLRKPDGSFLRKSKKIHDDSNSVVEYSSKGLWGISRNQYWEKLTYVSNPMWESEVGREFELQVLDLSENSFKYVSSDGATVVEKKIGGPSLAEFESARLKNLSP